MHVTVDCPTCGRWFVVSGRGRCRCGTYLIDHIAKGKGKVLDPHDPRPVYVRRDDGWEQVSPRTGSCRNEQLP